MITMKQLLKITIKVIIIFIFLGQDADYNKLKVEDLKAELKKRNIDFSKTARKSDLIDLLSKGDSTKTN